VLFGDHNPSGRLTQTWYRSDDDLPPNLRNYDIISTDQTYLYNRGTPLYPFGHGLSYTTFGYSNLRPSASTVSSTGKVTVSVDVTNTGTRSGAEVVQLYSHQRTSRDKVPVRALRTFDKVSLAPGETKTVRLTLPAADLAHWDVTRSRWVVESSTYDLLVGSSATDIRRQTTLRVNGETIPPRNLSKPTRAENFDRYAGIDLVDESKERGTSVGSTDHGGWVEFAGAKLDSSDTTFTATVAKADAGAGSIEVRLGAPDGQLLGTADVSSTGDVYDYATTTASLAAANGVHDVYLVLSPGLRLASFSLR
jgi:beta-glucosidase